MCTSLLRKYVLGPMWKWGKGRRWSSRKRQRPASAQPGLLEGLGTMGYLGAMPRQDLPLATGQGDLLLDGALKLICEKGEQRSEGHRKGTGSVDKGSLLMAG